MKRSLGKRVGWLLLLLVVWHVGLQANTYEWSAEVNKQEVYKNEAIYLHYQCSFSDRAELYAIDFNPVGEYEAYSLKLLRQTREIVDGKRIENYEYVAFAKHAGVIDFDFDMVMKKTNRDSIENAVIGRDNVQTEEFTKRFMKQKTLRVSVLDANISHVGVYTMQVHKSEPTTEAYIPYHLEVLIEGEGDFMFAPLSFAPHGVEVFAEEPQINTTLTQNGYVGTWRQKFAFVSDKNFTIDGFTKEYFDTKERRVRHFVMDSMDVKVTQGLQKEELLDDVKIEKKAFFSWEYLYYFLFFIFGFIVAKIKFTFKRASHAMQYSLEDKIAKTRSLQELALLLALQKEKRFEEILLAIETKKVTSLRETQKKVMRLITS